MTYTDEDQRKVSKMLEDELKLGQNRLSFFLIPWLVELETVIGNLLYSRAVVQKTNTFPNKKLTMLSLT